MMNACRRLLRFSCLTIACGMVMGDPGSLTAAGLPGSGDGVKGFGKEAFFSIAEPVWIEGKAEELNYHAGFRTVVPGHRGGRYEVRVTAATLYRLWVNGEFVMYGPARAAHGYLRVDAVDISPHIREGRNLIAFEVAGYNCPCHYMPGRSSFLQAEVLADGRPIAATGRGADFEGFELTSRHRKVVRFAAQRMFSEIYTLDGGDALAAWHRSAEARVKPVPLATAPHGCRYLPREVARPHFEHAPVEARIQSGRIREKTHPAGYRHPKKQYFEPTMKPDVINPTGGRDFPYFRLEDIPDNPYHTLLDREFVSEGSGLRALGLFPSRIAEDRYELYDMGRLLTGFIGARLKVLKDAQVYLVFDEALVDGAFAYIPSWQTVNVVKYNLKANDAPYDLLTFEPYSYRYVAVVVLEGEVEVEDIHMREYAHPDCDNAVFSCSDPRLQALADAGRETYRQHTLDAFMDNSGRERGAYLYESTFTAQGLPFYSGDFALERVFLENFLYPDRFPGMPVGMLPWTYPSGQTMIIPYYAMQYVAQLGDYADRSGDPDMKRFEPRVVGLFKYLDQYRNEDGLLEFPFAFWFSWEEATAYTRGVHYPINMLYARVLEIAARLFDQPALLKQGEQVRREVVRQSFDGSHFVDNALRGKDGRLRRTENRSQLCQHLAFLYGVADRSDPRFAPLARDVLEEMGPASDESIPEMEHYKRPGSFTDEMSFTPRRTASGKPFLAPMGLSHGWTNRVVLLLEWKEYDRLIEEGLVVHYPMTLTGGTFWEHRTPEGTTEGLDGIWKGSWNQGCSSIFGTSALRAVFGVQEINNRTKTVKLGFPAWPIRHTRIEVGTPHGPIVVERQSANGRFQVHYSVPKAYAVEVSLPAGREALFDVKPASSDRSRGRR